MAARLLLNILIIRKLTKLAQTFAIPHTGAIL